MTIIVITSGSTLYLQKILRTHSLGVPVIKTFPCKDLSDNSEKNI